jgi:hypothetical protein
VSKNLHCVLNIVNLFHESVLGGHLTEAEGKGIADGEQNTELKILIHNLLIVISTSKVLPPPLLPPWLLMKHSQR